MAVALALLVPGLTYGLTLRSWRKASEVGSPFWLRALAKDDAVLANLKTDSFVFCLLMNFVVILEISWSPFNWTRRFQGFGSR